MATAAQQQTKITIVLGDVPAITYVLAYTSAPDNYDGFGTISLYDNGEITTRDRERLVLIRAEHETWQSMRYRSGLYSYDPTDVLDAADIAGRMYGAIAGMKV